MCAVHVVFNIQKKRGGAKTGIGPFEDAPEQWTRDLVEPQPSDQKTFCPRNRQFFVCFSHRQEGVRKLVSAHEPLNPEKCPDPRNGSVFLDFFRIEERGIRSLELHLGGTSGVARH